jgi:hypothetical protein
MDQKTPYVKPEVEVIEFVFEDSIAASTQEGAWFNDTLWD